jgi:SOUL heme-binding protein
MWAKILAAMSALSLATCAGETVPPVEEPGYSVTASIGAVEVRQYGPRIAAETVADGDADAAWDAGFRRLADYGAGANHDGAGIAMTVPLVEAREGAARWRIRRVLPSGVTLATLPRPNDPSVALLPVPPETLAVLRYTGAASQEAVAARTADLVAALEGSAWRPAGAPVAWFYDPPWTLPPQRHNAVAIPVSPN